MSTEPGPPFSLMTLCICSSDPCIESSRTSADAAIALRSPSAGMPRFGWHSRGQPLATSFANAAAKSRKKACARARGQGVVSDGTYLAAQTYALRDGRAMDGRWTSDGRAMNERWTGLASSRACALIVR